MAVNPVFPVALIQKGTLFNPANAEDGTRREVYTDLESLTNSVEWLDTRSASDIWIEDANGTRWDVRIDIVKLGLETAEFFPRGE